jgi:CPA2 family monovalent cation:H+ antiporter-2
MSHDLPVLRELLVLASASLAVVLLFQRLRLPPTIGFIVTGILIGPNAFGLVRDPAFVGTLAEIGVVLLLFTVGLEFSLADLRRMGRLAVVGGGLQVGLTVAVVAAGLLAFGLPAAQALFFGMLASLSSTAVVFKLLTDRFELDAPHGRLATAVLLFQDFVAIAFLLAVPALGSWMRAGGVAAPRVGIETVLGTVTVIVAIVVLFAGGQRAVSWLLGRASRARSREAFLFGVMLVALGSASLASWAGLSLALGAFLAGLLLAESDLREQIAADVLPFRDVLASVFFIAIGMSFDPRTLLNAPGLVLASTIGLVVVKLGAASLAMRLAGAAPRVGFAAGLTLAQIGEFSFVLAAAGRPWGLLGPVGDQAFVSGAVFSLVLTPLLVARAPAWALALELRLGEWRARGGREAPAGVAPRAEDAPRSDLLAGHVVIGGFGLNGRNVARVLRATRLPHIVADLHPDALQLGRSEGSPVLLGDITRPLIQRQAGVPRARVLVLALSDATATRGACRIARSLSEHVHIVVRTRYVAEIDELFAAGANQVIPEEFETSIEIFTAVLREYHVPRNIVEAQIQLLRQERYSLMRGHKLPGAVVEQLDTLLAAGTTDTFLLLQHSPAVGKSLAELGLEGSRPECAAVAVVRGGRAIVPFDPGERLRVGDTLVLAGTHGGLDREFERLSPSPG